MSQNLSVSQSTKKIELKCLIENRDVFKNDFEFVKDVIDQVLEHKKNQKSNNFFYYYYLKTHYNLLMHYTV